ncbi:purine-nucleoside phosphorylase [Lonsdalea populi]|nr:purine-nucleoside phosphorylase [Lonsdalea populi]RAT68254.1 purine-nucleoside phosphorylase [Lonsdalea populi]RAT71373.1 purine-nucleoside phosphorylase [Lonsdalea populi]RAT76561.1 purine-nucleoside phosphorylase [Lonsdalea populi]RAT77686.1 purine-nucleoside phosphorylase [Lonsdalea populi]
MMNKILISACLAGFSVRYNGSNKSTVRHYLDQWQQEQRLIVFCPELAAGFPTPRPSTEIIPTQSRNEVIASGARVVEETGSDVTEHYILGAWLALEMAQRHRCQFALLTDGSPSCGSQTVYSGHFNGETVAGNGVTAELLRSRGLEVFSDGEILSLIERVNQVG